MTSPSDSRPTVTVLISGGFELAYRKAIPDFEQETGIKIETRSGASQGSGPKTIRYQLDHGAEVDVVILSNEGLHELIDANLIAEGSIAELATAPLAAAVQTGAPRSDVSSVAALTQTLLDARLVVMPASTSGLFIQREILPALGVADKVRLKVYPRGTDSAAALAAGEADLALGPISELVNIPGVEPVGVLPDEVQLVQTFSAAMRATAKNPDLAKQLIAFLQSDKAEAAVRQVGMEPLRSGRG
ncbi:substrate-binding domain-containing protein [Methylobacterium sp. WL8]|uniref:substrate-binding domain-containing protein n=1 Tax=Methylobacterium sp. WL8 TaxID=2603899 RepID=UPI0011C816CB|nr:substrate-binding domain-containing protein [Methylobacterium sp. WL8]TXN76927.1 ABC transporter substrate-binding protein [Methylobacterium sp. WL8]